jgi:type II secretory pathway pseudopilin PulG
MTLLELLTVVLIIGILSTFATNVYVGQTYRAKIAATKNTIRELSVAAVRYEIDTGELPLSGSGTVQSNTGGIPSITSRAVAPNMSALNNRNGSGLLYLSLVHGIGGDLRSPYPRTWSGPYIEFNASIIQTTDDFGNNLNLGQQQILDSFGTPFEYIRFQEYEPGGGTFTYLGIPNVPPYQGRGTRLFPGPRPASASPDLPGNNIFAATETFYNPRTFQIYSVGGNGITYDGFAPPADDPGIQFQGTEFDDISNFSF